MEHSNLQNKDGSTLKWIADIKEELLVYSDVEIQTSHIGIDKVLIKVS